MAEYIDREAAVDAVTDIYYDTPEINLTAEKFEAAINGIPSADVALVWHGRGVFDFKLTEAKFYRCSVCNRQVLTYKNIVDDCRYCHCGAKMDEGE